LSVLAGFGLHGARPATVRFRAAAGPVTLNGVPIAALELASTDRSTSVTGVGTVEHLFAALEARSIRQGLAIEVAGPEVPLLDGCAAAFFDALPPVGPSPRTVITRAAKIAEYTFAPGPDVRVEVTVDYDDPRITPSASWAGDPADFRARIATARTFGFEHEVAALMERGLASHVSPESVVVFTATHVLHAGPPFAADEPARHKLLDLLGDLYLHGGAPIGTIHALKPGHATTHAIMGRAIDEGVVAGV
jgi:UDP-3-O-[3-hydroxymyristoyl] N-acetylglucosamine deacetylase